MGRKTLPNSPGQVGKLRVSAPVAKQRFVLSSGLLYMGQRQTFGGATVAPAFVLEATLSSSKLIHNLSFTIGLRNFLNQPYRDPVALAGTIDTITRSGRTFFLSVVWHGME